MPAQFGRGMCVHESVARERQRRSVRSKIQHNNGYLQKRRR
jgi:hypothetical protein